MYRACTGIIPLRDVSYIDDPPGLASEKAMMIALSFRPFLRARVLALMIAIERARARDRSRLFFARRAQEPASARRPASARDSKTRAKPRTTRAIRARKPLGGLLILARGGCGSAQEKTG
jgi:hypothetical protein